ncbi:type IIL restriction-modification enzyme MmeI, partial [Enterococcus faecalis]|uniref:type IIL restriction-modification enzyme MmeI n=2 Tax=Enterococcus TaxID=1350 RepID=UPI00355B56D8
HQMNLELKSAVSEAVRPTLPLKSAGDICCGNALRIEWEKICPKEDNKEIFIFGNPPYLGASLQNDQQKKDMEICLKKIKGYKKLDYIAAWFYLGSKYIASNPYARLGLVTTNSITQGEQVAILWKEILTTSQIFYAYPSFKWVNNAKKNANVIVEIIGLLSRDVVINKRIFLNNLAISAKYISPYLTEGNEIIVQKSNNPLNGLPKLVRGNMPTDGGNLLISNEEIEKIINENPEIKGYIRRFVGSRDSINGTKRFVLWLDKSAYEKVQSNKFVRNRIEKVIEMRLSSSKKSTNELAKSPWKFEFISEPEGYNGQTLLIPRHSSVNRMYIPMSILSAQDVVADSAIALYNVELWIFAILESRMHMVWMKFVGGRLKEDYRYSNKLVYNTFPLPNISDYQKKILTDMALKILDVREEEGGTLSYLYDVKTMPNSLKEAHKQLDVEVDKIYKRSIFANDEERLSSLLKLYEKLI